MIFVFKTSVKSKKQAKRIGSYLRELFPEVKYNFDLEDCDKILRIDSDKNVTNPIISLLKHYNFDCVELE
jgi:hypothetical protein